LRYATTQAFLASVYADWSGCDPAKAAVYKEFAKKQVDYALGSTGRSFVVGFGKNPPRILTTGRPQLMERFNDRTCGVQTYLVGALVGGPDGSDSYVDRLDDYQCNEVANDYNAGFVGALAKMYEKYGGERFRISLLLKHRGKNFMLKLR